MKEKNNSKVLTSWKEIAAHFGKGVRTVQRWEQKLGLPVHRPSGDFPNFVFAIPEELSAWLDECVAAEFLCSRCKQTLHRLKEAHTELQADVAQIEVCLENIERYLSKLRDQQTGQQAKAGSPLDSEEPSDPLVCG